MTTPKETMSRNRVNYGNWNRGDIDFVGDWYEFKKFLYKKDFTLARIVLKDFRNNVETIRVVLAKMEKEYKLTRNNL